MKIILTGHDDYYSLYTMLKSFFPFEEISKNDNQEDQNVCLSSIKTTKCLIICNTQIIYKNNTETIKIKKKINELSMDKSEQKKQIKNLINEVSIRQPVS
jgi:hypothetical protein